MNFEIQSADIKTWLDIQCMQLFYPVSEKLKWMKHVLPTFHTYLKPYYNDSGKFSFAEFAIPTECHWIFKCFGVWRSARWWVIPDVSKARCFSEKSGTTHPTTHGHFSKTWALYFIFLLGNKMTQKLLLSFNVVVYVFSVSPYRVV
jgi:hypothetical protein